MKPGRASRTAELVAAARGAAHGRSEVSRYADPTALALLPEESRGMVRALQAGTPPPGRRERFAYEFLRKRADMMVARTVEIDDAVRAAGAPQLVLLGAGLDGRAFRMAELADAVVFEVDHPDSQREKRERAAALTPSAREIRWVAVDFARDDLGAALAAAGHDPARPTTWVWEGVVMYLERPAIEASLDVIAARSAPGSHLVVAYIAPALTTRIVGLLLRRVGEPFRSIFTADAFRALLDRHGFAVASDRDLKTIAGDLSPALGRRMRPMRHQRIAVATRR